MWQAELSFALARAGDSVGAAAILSGLLDRKRQECVSPYDPAIAFAGLKENASALDHLEQAVEERVMRVIAIGDPEFDALAAEPRYRRIAERLQLPAVP